MEDSLKCLKCGCPVISKSNRWRCPVCDKEYTICKQGFKIFLKEEGVCQEET